MFDKKNQWKAWLYLSPAIILLLVFTVWPIINTVRMAFLNGYNTYEAVNDDLQKTFAFGIENFKTVIKNPEFLTCMKNTILLCVLTVPISTILALLIAVCLNSIKRLQKVLQTIFFLPYVTNSIAIGMVFSTMFNVVGTGSKIKTVGVINMFLGLLLDFYNWTGIANIGFINDLLTNMLEWTVTVRLPDLGVFTDMRLLEDFVTWLNEMLRILLLEKDFVYWVNPGSAYFSNIIVMVVYIVWNALPFKILVLLGGLQGINKQYYDAAKIDGTSRGRIFSRITVPLLSPMLIYVVITGFIGGFKEYSSVVGIFGEGMGPGGNGALNTMVGMVYDSLAKGNSGTASAAALILFGIILVVTLINMRVSKKRVHY